MVHIHGGPITPHTAALATWKARHAMVSFAHPEQLWLAAEIASSVYLDNGAFSYWRSGEKLVVESYLKWVDAFRRHPTFRWALIPDVIDGSEWDNDMLLTQWPFGQEGVPVWHLHESLERLARLMHYWPTIALGSSGEFKTPGSNKWWERIHAAMSVVCDSDGVPLVKLHGLRMLAPAIVQRIPFASGDSTTVARNIGLSRSVWPEPPYSDAARSVRAIAYRDRLESYNSPGRWVP